jgi:hypothetical protein
MPISTVFLLSQYTEESDPHLAVIVRFAMDFLVQCERELGCVGLFVARTGDFKDRYHASYCGAVGLLDSPFSEVIKMIVCDSCDVNSFLLECGG